MHPSIRLPALLAIAALAACAQGEAKPLDEGLQSDLDQARASAIELAPRAGGQQVVSAIESAPPPSPRPRTSAPTPRRSPTPQPPRPAVRPVTAEPTEVEEVVVQAPAAAADTVAPVGAGRPEAPKAPARAKKGGWWSTGDVIRNAPFPVNP